MLTDYEKQIVANVDEFGWHGTSVAPTTNSDDSQEWWTYSTGLTKSHGWPELIIFGLNSDDAHAILWAAIRECEARDVVPQAGLRLKNTLSGYDAVLVDGRAIPDSYLNSARWFARHHKLAPPEVLQLLWPDDHGLFPFDEGCEPSVVSEQTPKETQ